MIFLPREKKFFYLYEAQINKILDGIHYLELLQKNYKKLNQIEKKMDKLEDEADDLVHQTINGLLYDHTRVTEEKGDIRYFVSNMDNIMDALEKVINRMKIYKIEKFPEAAKEFTPLLKEAALEIKKGIQCLPAITKKERIISACCVKINHLEEKGDKVNRKWLQKIMTSPVNSFQEVRQAMALKEIIDLLEYAMDQCEDVANVFDTFRLKGQV